MEGDVGGGIGVWGEVERGCDDGRGDELRAGPGSDEQCGGDSWVERDERRCGASSEHDGGCRGEVDELGRGGIIGDRSCRDMDGIDMEWGAEHVERDGDGGCIGMAEERDADGG